MGSIMAYHVETILNHQNPWDAIRFRFQLEKLMQKNRISRGEVD